jgi:hypothetical protein
MIVCIAVAEATRKEDRGPIILIAETDEQLIRLKRKHEKDSPSQLPLKIIKRVDTRSKVLFLDARIW